MVSDLNILQSPQGAGGAPSFWGDWCTHLAAHSSKGFKPLSAVMLLCPGNTSKKHDCTKTAVSLVALL